MLGRDDIVHLLADNGFGTATFHLESIEHFLPLALSLTLDLLNRLLALLHLRLERLVLYKDTSLLPLFNDQLLFQLITFCEDRWISNDLPRFIRLLLKLLVLLFKTC